MNGVSQVNYGDVKQYDGYGAVSSNETAVNSYEHLDADLTIKTREGDVVTLSAGMFSQLDAYAYDSQANFAKGRDLVSSSYSEREITLSSGEQFTFSVQGELSEAELKDIEGIVAGIDGIITEMAQGDMDEAVAQALSMGTYDSISKYAADITMERAYSAYEENAITYGRRGQGRDGNTGLGLASLVGSSPQTPPFWQTDETVSPFMDQVTTLLAQQKEEIVAWARDPLSQLFTHHLDALKAPKEDDVRPKAEEGNTGADRVSPVALPAVEDKGGWGAAESVTANPNDTVGTARPTRDAGAQMGGTPGQILERKSLYGILENAAARIDALIHTLTQEIFGNTLDRMV